MEIHFSFASRLINSICGNLFLSFSFKFQIILLLREVFEEITTTSLEENNNKMKFLSRTRILIKRMHASAEDISMKSRQFFMLLIENMRNISLVYFVSCE
jgi:hypothetical protein